MRQGVNARIFCIYYLSIHLFYSLFHSFYFFLRFNSLFIIFIFPDKNKLNNTAVYLSPFFLTFISIFYHLFTHFCKLFPPSSSLFSSSSLRINSMTTRHIFIIFFFYFYFFLSIISSHILSFPFRHLLLYLLSHPY